MKRFILISAALLLAYATPSPVRAGAQPERGGRALVRVRTSDFARAFPLLYDGRMKCFCAAMILLLWSAVAAFSAGPNEQYVRVYSMIQEGDKLESSNRETEALAVYMDAEKVLAQLKRSDPLWNPKVVDFRLRYWRKY